MVSNPGFSSSAFLVNESRARNVALSRDRYAHLWVTPETRRVWEDFSCEVYPHDDIELPLRNRFYLDILEKAVRERPSAVFLNLGAGFSSYPFLVERPCRSIEVDFEHICRFKEAKMGEWRAKGLLPQRDVEFIACDLGSEKDVAALADALRSATGANPSVAFLEGITYYLKREALERILSVLRKVQTEGSRIALDFWPPEYEEHPVHGRFRKFFAGRFGHAESDYHFFGTDLLRALDGYDIVETTDIVELERRFSSERRLADPGEILPERYAVLERRERK
jgi:O-methyltransferase involved in polyketide biosynthesis